MKKRLFPLILSLAVATSMLAGCGQSADGKSDSSSSQRGEQAEASVSDDAQESSSSAEEEAPEEEKQEITWLGYYTSNITVTENSWAEQLLEETFNVEINPITDVTAENCRNFSCENRPGWL